MTGFWVVLGRVCISTIWQRELGVVLDLVKEENFAVGHETCVHSRDTSLDF